jgi:small subunit ribosomal protein S1
MLQISGVTGLVHKSELSWEMVTVTSSVVKPRQEVKVKLLSVDRDSNRISLSIRQCMVSPAYTPPVFINNISTIRLGFTM